MAAYNLGVAYTIGEGVEPDMNKALSLFHQTAEEGCHSSQVNLGWAYKQEERRDDKKAATWLQHAAYKGVPSAMYGLGIMYRYAREGFVKDMAKAIVWFRAAARAGHQGATEELEALVEEEEEEE